MISLDLINAQFGLWLCHIEDQYVPKTCGLVKRVIIERLKGDKYNFRTAYSSLSNRIQYILKTVGTGQQDIWCEMILSSFDHKEMFLAMAVLHKTLHFTGNKQ